jgi:predicted nucleotidyltransferase
MSWKKRSTGKKFLSSEALMSEELQKIIDHAAAILKEEGADEIFVFGSAAEGSMTEHSDIDIAASGIPPERFYAAAGRIYGIGGRPFDLIDLDDQSEFADYLKREGKLHRVV